MLAGRPVRAGRLLGAALAVAGAAGCTLPPAGTEASRPDEAACRARVAASGAPDAPGTAEEQRALARSDVVLATEAGAGPAGTSSPPPAPPLTRQIIYARCMRAGQG
ncbi:MAG: hypothetical protein ACRYG6_07760 [Janthinobacterium lividum]